MTYGPSLVRITGWTAIGPAWRRLLVLPVLVVMADWLLNGADAHWRFPTLLTGLGTAVLLVVVAGASLLVHGARAPVRRMALAVTVLALGVLPLVLACTVTSVTVAVLSVAYFVLVAGGLGHGDVVDRVLAACALVAEGCGRLVIDLFQRRKRDGAAPIDADDGGLETGRPTLSRQLLAWLLPVGLGVVFLLLFRSANPVIDDWLTVDMSGFMADFSLPRLLFWGLTVMLAWPFVARCRPLQASFLWHAGRGLGELGRELCASVSKRDSTGAVFGPAAVFRSLVLFNLLFGVQTVLDLAYLWGGAQLPDGMSHATYAHRGAYPLVATALLAAVFVLAAMRPGAETGRSREIKGLVFLWIAQNVLLVVSSLMRLDLYVSVYSLTYLRVAALAWMVLVAIGLVLIVVRIALGRSNRWLLSVNLGALLLMLYGFGFVNVPALIASYNVDHAQAVSADGRPLDLGYLRALGPQALPALDRYIAAVDGEEREDALEVRDLLARQNNFAMRDWRNWSIRSSDLSAYLAVREIQAETWNGPAVAE